MTVKRNKSERNRESFDKELALTNDILVAVQQLAAYAGWRASVRQALYAISRVSQGYGHRWLAEFITTERL